MAVTIIATITASNGLLSFPVNKLTSVRPIEVFPRPVTRYPLGHSSRILDRELLSREPTPTGADCRRPFVAKKLSLAAPNIDDATGDFVVPLDRFRESRMAPAKEREPCHWHGNRGRVNVQK